LEAGSRLLVLKLNFLKEMAENAGVKRLIDEVLPGEDDLIENPTKLKASRDEESDEPIKVDANQESVVGAPMTHSQQILNIGGVPGLYYYPNFVSPEEERLLINDIDSNEWDNTLKRRVQHFGLRYDYTSKSVDKSATIEPLPDFCSDTVSRLVALELFPKTPDQCIVNGSH
jgi:hypothetical protein